MFYVFLLYGDPALPKPADVIQQHGSLSADLKQRNALVCSAGLDEPPAAATIRIRSGEAITTDGPFAETKEVLGGIYIVECDNMDEALEYAKRVPTAQFGAVEVRPVQHPDEAWVNRLSK